MSQSNLFRRFSIYYDFSDWRKIYVEHYNFTLLILKIKLDPFFIDLLHFTLIHSLHSLGDKIRYKLIDVHPLYYKKKNQKIDVAVTSLFAIMEGKEWSSFENRTVSRPWPPWCLVCLYSILASSGTL